MPTVTVAPVKGDILQLTVTDKADAIRKISTQLLQVYSRSSVETALNNWLKNSMTAPLRLGAGMDTMTLNYRS
jgi:hypothetical protein